MKIIDLKTGKAVRSLPGKTVLALGNFDGVHAGHAELLKKTAEEAKELGAIPAVWTFGVHPLAYLSKDGFRFLTTNEEKNSVFAEKGMSYAVYEDFRRVRDLSPETFVKELLIQKLGCECAVCGFNFSFGKGGLGTPEKLLEIMKSEGKRAVIVPPVYRCGRIVSSTAVRFFVEEGLMEEAAELIGRPFSIDFPVVEGKKLGRRIGIPTINQSFPKDHIKPKTGIYAASCEIGGDVFLCVANVGSRPTVNPDENDVNCETHIINYCGWLYGKRIKVSFYKRLRDEKKFDSVEELKKAVELDIENAKRYFNDK